MIMMVYVKAEEFKTKVRVTPHHEKSLEVRNLLFVRQDE